MSVGTSQRERAPRPAPWSPAASTGVAERVVPAWRLVFAVAMAATVVFASNNQAPEIPGLQIGGDKVVHFGVFGLIATLVARVSCVRRWRGLGAWWAVVAVSLFGVTDELHQSFTPGRMMDWLDWVADTLGALVATAVYLRWGAYRRLLERRIGRRRRERPEAAG